MFAAQGFWQQFTEWIQNLIVGHWIKALLAAGFLLLTTAVGSYQAWWALRKRRFYSRFHFSLNVLADGMLLIRTVDEQPIDDVLLKNGTLRRRLLRAARRTRPGRPFLDLGPHTWTALNAALNELARLVGSQGWLHRDLGLPVEIEDYIIGLTCESDPDVRVRKVRLMIVREATLERIAAGEVPRPRFESPHHAVRWETLKAMAAIYRREKDEGFHQLLGMQVALPVAASLQPTEDPSPAPFTAEPSPAAEAHYTAAEED